MIFTNKILDEKEFERELKRFNEKENK